MITTHTFNDVEVTNLNEAFDAGVGVRRQFDPYLAQVIESSALHGLSAELADFGVTEDEVKRHLANPDDESRLSQRHRDIGRSMVRRATYWGAMPPDIFCRVRTAAAQIRPGLISALIPELFVGSTTDYTTEAILLGGLQGYVKWKSVTADVVADGRIDNLLRDHGFRPSSKHPRPLQVGERAIERIRLKHPSIGKLVASIA